MSMNDDKLTPLREQIDAIDAQILDLLNQRAGVAQEVGHVKAETNAPVFRPEREAQVLRSVAERNPGPLADGDVQTIFREIMSACRALEKRVTVAYLGPAGTFSEQAVYQQFGHAVEGLPCASIDEVFRATEAGTADFGVVPVENSSEGAINRTLDLLLQTTADHQRRSVDPGPPQPDDGKRQHGRRDAHLRAFAGAGAVPGLAEPALSRHRAPAGGVQRRSGAHGQPRIPTIAAIAGEIAGEQAWPAWSRPISRTTRTTAPASP